MTEKEEQIAKVIWKLSGSKFSKVYGIKYDQHALCHDDSLKWAAILQKKKTEKRVS